MTVASVQVEVAPPYAVHVGAGALELARAHFALERGRFLVSDARVHGLYGAQLDPSSAARTHLVPEGEAAKSFEHLEGALEFLARQNADRRASLWTLGGGSVGDLGGLAAALYMRGIAVVHCPTTLLAQVDASVGGKSAINLQAGKNLAGAFHQPRAVYADTRSLASLDPAQYASGLGEVVKTAVIEGEAALAALERGQELLLRRDLDTLDQVVLACVRTKARVVAADPAEAGPRRALNLGHSFAHAIEHAAGYGRVPHGVAVAVGVALALRASRELGLLEDRGLEPRLRALCAGLGLPFDLAALRRDSGQSLAPRELVAAMARDKKNRAGELHLVLPLAPGRLELAVPADGALVESWLS